MAEDAIRVSIVVPAYNAGAFIGETLESLSNQTFRDFEIVVVDDGSTDDTADQVERMAAAAPLAGHLQLIRQANGGPSSARNRGIAAARGAYVGFLDADDRWHPTKIARQVALMDEDDALDLTCSWWRVIDESGQDTGRRGGPPSTRISLRDLVLDNIIGTTSNVIVRRRSLASTGGFEDSLSYCEDYDLWLRIARSDAANMACVIEPLVDRRVREAQLTKNWSRMDHGWREVMARFRQTDAGLPAALLRQSEARHDRYIAYLAYEAGDFAAARRHMIQAWQKAALPMARDKRAWVMTVAALGSLLPSGLHRGVDIAVRRLRGSHA
jgi:glycosyltransferase involved in cell wall biosynthesis